MNTLAGYARARGYDGLIVRNVYDSMKFTKQRATTFVVFHPTQIKSAIGNRGTFDPQDPNILHGLRGLGDDGDDQRRLRCNRSGQWKSPDGLSTGIPLDRALPYFARVGRKLPYRGEPDVTIYRGVPKGIGGFRLGDWVALTRRYAVEHGGRGSTVIAKTVPAHEVIWAGTDENEWWWCPS